MLLLVTSSTHERETKWQKRHPEGKRPLGRPRHNGRIRGIRVGIGWLSIGSSGESSEDYFENEGRLLPKKGKFLTN
jgi:hypothetical protein